MVVNFEYKRLKEEVEGRVKGLTNPGQRDAIFFQILTEKYKNARKAITFLKQDLIGQDYEVDESLEALGHSSMGKGKRRGRSKDPKNTTDEQPPADTAIEAASFVKSVDISDISARICEVLAAVATFLNTAAILIPQITFDFIPLSCIFYTSNLVASLNLLYAGVSFWNKEKLNTFIHGTNGFLLINMFFIFVPDATSTDEPLVKKLIFNEATNLEAAAGVFMAFLYILYRLKDGLRESKKMLKIVGGTATVGAGLVPSFVKLQETSSVDWYQDYSMQMLSEVLFITWSRFTETRELTLSREGYIQDALVQQYDSGSPYGDVKFDTWVQAIQSKSQKTSLFLSLGVIGTANSYRALKSSAPLTFKGAVSIFALTAASGFLSNIGKDASFISNTEKVAIECETGLKALQEFTNSKKANGIAFVILEEMQSTPFGINNPILAVYEKSKGKEMYSYLKKHIETCRKIEEFANKSEQDFTKKEKKDFLKNLEGNVENKVSDTVKTDLVELSKLSPDEKEEIRDFMHTLTRARQISSQIIKLADMFSFVDDLPKIPYVKQIEDKTTFEPLSQLSDWVICGILLELEILFERLSSFFADLQAAYAPRSFDVDLSTFINTESNRFKASTRLTFYFTMATIVASGLKTVIWAYKQLVPNSAKNKSSLLSYVSKNASFVYKSSVFLTRAAFIKTISPSLFYVLIFLDYTKMVYFTTPVAKDLLQKKNYTDYDAFSSYLIHLYDFFVLIGFVPDEFVLYLQTIVVNIPMKSKSGVPLPPKEINMYTYLTDSSYAEFVERGRRRMFYSGIFF